MVFLMLRLEGCKKSRYCMIGKKDIAVLYPYRQVATSSQSTVQLGGCKLKVLFVGWKWGVAIRFVDPAFLVHPDLDPV